MNTYDILVIVLSVLLGIFLILSVVIAVLVYKLVRSLREIASKGGELVDRVEEVGQTFAKNAGAVSLLKMLMKFIATANKARRN
ncbi:MAG: hypothetical protein WBP03_00235 [Candidatus Saccharimonadales bacterium]|jgi:membrane protein implicated in regulation of membrane protease activity